MQKIRAAVCHEFGKPLVIEEVLLRAPAAGEVEVVGHGRAQVGPAQGREGAFGRLGIDRCDSRVPLRAPVAAVLFHHHKLDACRGRRHRQHGRRGDPGHPSISAHVCRTSREPAFLQRS
jgi:hypothetical protein